MDDSILQDRRRFLEGLGLGGGVLLAGCTDQLGLGDDDGEDTPAATGDTAGSAAAIAAVDQEALMEEQATIQEDVRNGDMDQQEAQEALLELQEKYLGEAMDSLTGVIEATDGVTVGETYQSLGAVTVDGEAGAILGLLGSDDVRALVSAADVTEQAQTQSQQG